MDLVTVLAPYGAGSASQCPKTHVPADQTRGEGPDRVRPGHSARRERVLRTTVLRVRCRLSGPPRGSGDSPSTVWCRVSFPMPKDPRTGRPDAWRRSGPCSPRALRPTRAVCSGQRTLGHGVGSASRLADRVTVLAPYGSCSASQCPKVPVPAPDAHSASYCVLEPGAGIRDFGIAKRDWTLMRASVRPARATLSSGKLPRCHAVGTVSPCP